MGGGVRGDGSPIRAARGGIGRKTPAAARLKDTDKLTSRPLRANVATDASMPAKSLTKHSTNIVGFHTCMRAQRHTDIKKHTHAHTHARTHARTHACMHACTNSRRHAGTQARRHKGTQVRRQTGTHIQMLSTNKNIAVFHILLHSPIDSYYTPLSVVIKIPY